jgi:uncharacterized protein (DUF1778 family)
VIFRTFEIMKAKLARFDTRWTEEQKHFFERASVLAGYRSLSEFVFVAVQKRAEEIVESHERLLASDRDAEVFMQALLAPQEANSVLKKAAERYRKAVEEDGVRHRTA